MPGTVEVDRERNRTEKHLVLTLTENASTVVKTIVDRIWLAP